MDYTILYDVSQQSPWTSFPWFVLLFPIAGLLFFYRNRNGETFGKAVMAVCFFAACSFAAIIIVNTIITTTHYGNLVNQGLCSTKAEHVTAMYHQESL